MMKMNQPSTRARIIRNPRVCAVEPTLEGTRIPVRCIVVEYQLSGDLEAVRRAYPRLDVPSIQAALAFYQANREEVDRLIQENEHAAYAAD